MFVPILLYFESSLPEHRETSPEKVPLLQQYFLAPHWLFSSVEWKMLPCTSPAVEKKGKKSINCFITYTLHTVSTKKTPKTPKWRGLPMSLCQVVPLVVDNAILSCKSCRWYPYGCSYPRWNSTRPARWQIFPLLLFARRVKCWGLDSILQLPGQRQTSMKGGADKARLAPLCGQGNKAGQAENGGKTQDKA